MQREELAAWLHLLSAPGIGRIQARRLLAAFGSPQAVFEAPHEALVSTVGTNPARGLGSRPADLDARVDASLAWRAEAPLRHLLALGDPAYPAAWLELPDPPLLLWAIGDLSLLQRPALAIVGTRHPTPDGIEHARSFAAAASGAGLSVVSGLAAGVDGAAHEGALDGPGRTIALVGTGIDRVYPRQHLALARRIADEGLLLSELELGTPPLAAHFPQRNRLIAGLALGTLVVEAALRSGSLITARLAAEAGREVFAIPGSIHNPQSRGCHALIRQGAKLVESLQDVLEELHLAAPADRSAAHAAPSSGPQAHEPQAAAEAAGSADSADPSKTADDPLLAALGWSPATLDVLQVRTGLSAAELALRLLDLELCGQVLRLPGALYQRNSQA